MQIINQSSISNNRNESLSKNSNLGTYQDIIDTNDYLFLAEQLSIAFSIDYMQGENKAKVIQLFGILQEEKYSKQDLRHCLKEFLKNQLYPTWKPADFIQHARPKIYDFSKVLELTNGTTKGFKPAKLDNNTVWIKQEQKIQAPLEEFEPPKYRINELPTGTSTDPTEKAKQLASFIGIEV